LPRQCHAVHRYLEVSLFTDKRIDKGEVGREQATDHRIGGLDNGASDLGATRCFRPQRKAQIDGSRDQRAVLLEPSLIDEVRQLRRLGSNLCSLHAVRAGKAQTQAQRDGKKQVLAVHELAP
jgi:hypothetical protein